MANVSIDAERIGDVSPGYHYITVELEMDNNQIESAINALIDALPATQRARVIEELAAETIEEAEKAAHERGLEEGRAESEAA